MPRYNNACIPRPILAYEEKSRARLALLRRSNHVQLTRTFTSRLPDILYKAALALTAGPTSAATVGRPMASGTGLGGW
jgi:hypothetical protein